MKKTWTQIIVLTLLSTPAYALHKCTINGKTVIQEQPCPGVRRSESMPITYDPLLEHGGQLEGSEPVEIGKLTCKRLGPTWLSLKDPESLRVGEVTGGQMAELKLSGKTFPSRKFILPVNAKNSFGGYVGEKATICYTSTDGTRVIYVDKGQFE